MKIFTKTNSSKPFLVFTLLFMMGFQSGFSQPSSVRAQGEEPQMANAAWLLLPAEPPMLAELVPSEVIVGQGDLEITINGFGFQENSVVYLNGTDSLASVFVSETQILATLPASVLSPAGELRISVSTPEIGFSNELTFFVEHAVAELTSLLPDHVIAGDGGLILALHGNNFSHGAQAFWNDIQLDTTFINANQLEAAIPDAFLNNVGSAWLKVLNVAGGESSEEMAFEIYPYTAMWLAQSPEGGDVMDVDIDPNNPAVIYAATRSAGLFKSSDGGERWYQTNNGIDTSDLWSVTVNPANSSLVIATGRNGIYRSTNAGAFWKKVIEQGVGGTDSVKFHRSNPNVVFVATYAAVYRSDDAGVTWSNLTGTKLGGTPGWDEELVHVAVDASDVASIYVLEKHGVVNELWKTTNNGQTWDQITESTNGLPAPRSIYADPFQSNALYAGTSSGIYKSEDGGTTWRQLTTWVPWALHFIANVPGQFYAHNFQGINKTGDGGETWELVDLSPISYFITMDSDPNVPEIIYAGSYAGISKSVDGGQTWELKNKGLYALETNGLVFAPQSQSLYASTGMGGLWKSSDLGQNWQKIFDGPANSLSLDPNNGDHLFMNGNYETLDGGLTWNVRDFEPEVRTIVFAENSDLYGGNFNSTTTQLRIFKSSDNGDSWIQKNVGLPDCSSDTCWISFISTDPSDANIVYAGIGKSVFHPEQNWNEYFSSLYKTIDGGDHWFKIVSNLTYYSQSIYLRCLTVDPSNSSKLYLGTDWGMYKSSDGGISWKLSTVGGDFSKFVMPINIVAVDSINGKVLYLGTEGRGVYRSLDGGTSWSKFNYGLPSSRVYALVAVPPTFDAVSFDSLGFTRTLASNSHLISRVYTAAGGTVYGYFSVNYEPTGISLSATSVAGKLPAGSLVGKLLAQDQNVDDAFMYSLASGDSDVDNASFRISGNRLLTNEIFDQAVRNVYNIRIRATDRGGMSIEKNFQVSISANSKAPLLVAPAGGTQLLQNKPQFDWENVNGATSYTLQISTQNSFSLLVLSASTKTSSFNPSSPLPPNRTLFWRVRRNAVTGAGPWSQVLSIRTANPPGIPLPVSPAKDSLIKNYSPRLDWSTSALPANTTFDHYLLEVATDSGFQNLVVNNEESDRADSEYQLTSSLQPNTKYYWRVRSVNTIGQFSAWSPVWMFRTALLPPELVSPTKAAASLELRPAFVWNPVEDATGYTVQIARNDIFTQVAHTGNPAGTSYVPTVDLPKNVTLFWRVLAKGTNGPSQYSEIRSLTTPINPPPAPVLVAPANNVIVTTYDNPILKWKPVTFADASFKHYQVQLADNAAFMSPVLDDTTITNRLAAQLNTTLTLTPNTKYYWRVRAVNTNDELSNWSTVWTIRAAIPAPTLVSPSDDATGVSRKPLLDWGDVSDNAGYVLQVWKAGTTPTLIKTVTLPPGVTQYRFITNLLPNTKYIWKVQTRSGIAPSSWSQFDFRTGP